MLVLILALANGPQPSVVSDMPDTPSRDTGAVTASVGEAVGGAWTGEWADTDARAPVPLEASFSTGAATTVFGYFTFVERGVRRTVLRQGTAVADGLRFAWPGGRSLRLHLTSSGRLEGRMLAISDHDAERTSLGSMSLSRLRR